MPNPCCFWLLSLHYITGTDGEVRDEKWQGRKENYAQIPFFISFPVFLNGVIQEDGGLAEPRRAIGQPPTV
jgi:hypothetical protein